jgi:hypothetical protein
MIADASKQNQSICEHTHSIQDQPVLRSECGYCILVHTIRTAPANVTNAQPSQALLQHPNSVCVEQLDTLKLAAASGLIQQRMSKTPGQANHALHS